MQIETTPLDGVLILTPRRFADSRGHFSETWNQRVLAEAGVAREFVQDNHSWSRDAGTVRGLHYQSPPSAQDKLVRVARGRIWDVAVDVRRGSSSYGQWTGVELSDENGRQLLVPKGFLHGFATLEPGCDVVYKCSAFYDPATEGAVRFDDPALGIDWHLPGSAHLSDKDAAAPSFAEFQSPFNT
ncbi:MAG: dTDP-4-dehydrorhamnose 3,5-epimerase [Pseudomonadota bacterium]